MDSIVARDIAASDLPDFLGHSEVRWTASLSEKLRNDWRILKAAGWRVVHEQPGFYCDSNNKVINMDKELMNAATDTELVRLFAHECGHAMRGSRIDTSSRKSYIQSMLDHEGAAKLYEIDVNGKSWEAAARISNPFSNWPENIQRKLNRVYDTYLKVGTPRAYQKAIRATGKHHSDRVPSTDRTTTYYDLFGRQYDTIFGPAAPGDPDAPHPVVSGPDEPGWHEGGGDGSDTGGHGRDGSGKGAGEGATAAQAKTSPVIKTMNPLGTLLRNTARHPVMISISFRQSFGISRAVH